MQGRHWERIWAGAIPDDSSSLFVGEGDAVTQQNLKTFLGK